MKNTLTHFIFSLLFFFSGPINAQVQQSQSETRDNPTTGVLGACGYNANQHGGNQAPQNGNGTLGVIYDQQKCGLDFTSASQRLGKRFSPAGINQPAPFAISGIPACAIIEKAYLWAEGSGNGAAQTATIAGPYGTLNFPMTVVGSGQDKCWGYSGTYTYRADVTAVVGGNGTYNISGILTNPPTSGNDMDGATLLVIWSLPSATWAGRIVIADGAIVMIGGTTTYNMPISPAVCGVTNTAKAFMGVGDIQFNPTSWSANGTAIPLGWNWWDFRQVNTTVANGQATSAFNVNSGGDCYNLCIAGLYFRTTTCTSCPTTAALTVTPAATPATCSACNGSASVTVLPAGSYTYSWAPSGGTGSTATGLCAGVYTVTITGSCVVQTQTVNVPTSGGTLTVTGSQTNVGCFGQCTGSATATVSGGTAPYTFTWSPAATNSTVGATNTGSNLCAGTYIVTVTDAGGCTGTRTVTITQPPAITLTPSQTNIQCNGQCTGSATVTASGGTGSYTYLWSPSGGTGASATGLCAGTYTCIVTSGPAGCTATQTFNITQVPIITATQTQTNITCYGSCTGSAAVVASGGTGTYTYSWAPAGGSGATATGLCAGTYTCTITSGPAGCTITQTFNITQPTAITLTPAQTNITCYGQCTGTASVTATGGTGTYAYAWAPSGGTGASATNLCAGTYTCTVSSPAGCTATQTFNITQPPAITATQSQTNILCNGTCTGAASVVASGGTGTYTYSWAPSGGTGASATGLCAGTYTCIITSGPVGCTITQTFNITQPTALAATTSSTAATCGNNNGAASITVTGGTSPYTYAWTPSGSGPNPTGLGAGSYVVTVTDANGCTLTRTITITNAGSPTATITGQTNVSCFGGNNGSATVSASGGTGPYTYAWTPSGGSAPTGTPLTAGPYTVTVTDANGCVATATVTITEPPAMVASTSSSPVLCFGGSTGSATVTATGGTGTFTYAWSPSGGSSATATGLGAGPYTCLVTDQNGCTLTASTTVTQPTALTATATSSPVLCFGGTTGSASVSATGGTGSYSYAWSPSGGSAATATGLGAGPYTCLITDVNGCTFTASVTVTQPTALSATTSFTQSTCGSANGSASVTASGGAGSYTYAWSPSGGSLATATGLFAGPYTCLITDANGCTYTASVTVLNAGSPTATITSQTNVSCFGGNDGSATVSASGGTSPYNYAWSPSGGNTPTGTPLTAGPYTVTVTDANGCSATATVNITEPPQLTATATGTAVLCYGGSTGSASITATGGTGTYTYAWSPSGGSSANATGLAAGPYSCLVTDQNGCTTTATVNITEPTALTATTTFNPVSCNGGNDGTATTTPTGGSGTYSYAWSPIGGNSATASGLTAQPYTCLVTDQNGCTFTASVTVTQPPVLAATSSFTQSTCSAANGAASVSVTGGTPAYSYLWSPSNGTGPVENNLAAGVYTCLITDSKGCTLTMTVTVPNAASPSVTIIATDSVSCFGGNDGFIAVSSSGGTSPYTYLWSNGDADSLAGNLGAGGPYSVTVTDANGCTSTTSGMIGEPPMLTVTATATDVLCNGGNTGTATATATGGTGACVYNWSPSGGNSANATGLSQGVYTIDVTDANGCAASANVTVNEPPVLTLSATFAPVSCNGGSNGTATANATGGFGSYSFMWTPGNDTNATATGLQQGAYACVVTDQNGCTASASTTVTEPTAIVVTTSAVDAHCNQSDGSVSSNGTGGTGTLGYQWINAGGPATFDWNNIPSGTYSVVVSDANGCSATASQLVQNLNGVTAVLNTATNLTCFQSNDGFIDIDANGGTLPYTYTWNPAGPTGDSASGLAAGSYVITATDAAGCSSSVTVLLTEPSLLTVQASANPSAVCAGSSVQLSANASGGTPGYIYSWMPGPLIGQNQTIVPTASGPWPVIVTDVNGCTATASVNVTVNPMPVSNFVADDTAGCAPVCVNFSDLSSVASGTITSWSWDFGDLSTSSQQTPPLHCYNNAGVYTVILTVTTNSGCSQTLTMANYINVFAMPVAAFGASPQPTTILDPVIHFTDSSINASTWMWSFGDIDNSSSTDQNPTFEYPEPDCYAVQLTVTSNDGCVDTATDVVCIDPDVTIYVPNTFTPDDNGLNDVFLPVAIGIDENDYELWIFDRWGNMIFYSDELGEGWDGRVQGGSEVCQVDTYVWKIKCKDILGKRHDLIGHVNLIK